MPYKEKPNLEYRRTGIRKRPRIRDFYISLKEAVGGGKSNSNKIKDRWGGLLERNELPKWSARSKNLKGNVP